MVDISGGAASAKAMQKEQVCPHPSGGTAQGLRWRHVFGGVMPHCSSRTPKQPPLRPPPSPRDQNVVSESVPLLLPLAQECPQRDGGWRLAANPTDGDRQSAVAVGSLPTAAGDKLRRPLVGIEVQGVFFLFWNALSLSKCKIMHPALVVWMFCWRPGTLSFRALLVLYIGLCRCAN